MNARKIALRRPPRRLRPPTPPRQRPAFTLIELLVVVGVIAILAAIAIPNFLAAQIRAKVSRARADMRTVATALEAYAVSENHYPPVIGLTNGLGQPDQANNGYGSNRDGGWQTLPPQLTTPVAYLSTLPADPFKVGASHSAFPDPGKPYASGNPFDMGFIYHNIAQFTVTAPTRYDAGDIGDYGQWRMYSIGPDLRINNIGTADRTLGWLYDPTNGAVSSGELIRTQADPEGKRFTRF